MDEAALRQSVKRFFDIDNEVYSARMATAFCIGLSAILWWIPLFGPAVAGYVCGRKTGSMMKGLFCALLSGTLLLVAVWGLSMLVLGHGGYPEVPADEAAAVLSGIVGATASYLQTFFVAGTSDLNLMSLGVVTVFGGVGGILSRQARKEAAHLIAIGAGTGRSAPRSATLYASNKEMGFKSFDDCIAAQRMATNENKDSHAGQKEEKAKPQGRPVATTVQTVTTTVTGSTSTTQNKGQGNPFSDILGRSDRKRDEK